MAMIVGLARRSCKITSQVLLLLRRSEDAYDKLWQGVLGIRGMMTSASHNGYSKLGGISCAGQQDLEMLQTMS